MVWIENYAWRAAPMSEANPDEVVPARFLQKGAGSQRPMDPKQTQGSSSKVSITVTCSMEKSSEGVTNAEPSWSNVGDDLGSLFSTRFFWLERVPLKV